jgi:tRNA pseudouridine55 synthase
VGHTGTLDPVASGVLVLMLGSATRIAQFLQEDDKEYRLSMRLGIATDTQDMTGKIIAEENASGITREQVAHVLENYRGTIMQVPPAFSAVKKNGQRLYKLARQGLLAQADPREVTVHRLELNTWEPPLAGLEVKCSKGTYMRTLCHDIGGDLGVGGCMDSLIRTRSGSFSLNEAVRLDELKASDEPQSYLKPAARGLSFTAVEPEAGELAQLVAGMEVELKEPVSPGMISLIHEGYLVAIGEVKTRDGRAFASPRRVLEPGFKELSKHNEKC